MLNLSPSPLLAGQCLPNDGVSELFCESEPLTHIHPLNFTPNSQLVEFKDESVCVCVCVCVRQFVCF